MKKIIVALLLVASQTFAAEIYSRVYVAKRDTTMSAVFNEIKATPQEREEILKFNPQLERLDSIPAGTILNLSLYGDMGNHTTSRSFHKIKLKNNKKERNYFSVIPMVTFNNFKTGLNNDAEISTSSRTYGVGLNFEIPQTSLFALDFYSKLMNVEFTNVKVKQQTEKDSTPASGESRLNYDLGVKGTFNKSNYFNSFSMSLSRKVDHQYYFSKGKTFYTSNVGDYTELSSFSAWWVGAEFNQSLPFFNFPLEAGLAYGFILDGNITSDESSEVKNLNGSQGTLSLRWKFSDSQTFGLSYQNFSYQSEFSSTGSSFGAFGSFKI